MAAGTADNGAAVKTASRTLDVIEAFVRRGMPLSLTELAREIGAPISTCHGVVRTLQGRGYLMVLDRKRALYPTRRLQQVALGVARHDPIVARLRPVLAALRDRTDETVVLARREGDEVVYLDVLESSQTIRYAPLPGDRKPIHSSSLGKALLSAGGRADFDAFLSRRPLLAVTPNTITDGARLWADIEAARGRGYFVSRAENVPEVMGVSVLLPVGDELLALALSGPIARYQTHFDFNLGELMKTVATICDATA